MIKYEPNSSLSYAAQEQAAFEKLINGCVDPKTKRKYAKSYNEGEVLFVCQHRKVRETKNCNNWTYPVARDKAFEVANTTTPNLEDLRMRCRACASALTRHKDKSHEEEQPDAKQILPLENFEGGIYNKEQLPELKTSF